MAVANMTNCLALYLRKRVFTRCIVLSQKKRKWAVFLKNWCAHFLSIEIFPLKSSFLWFIRENPPNWMSRCTFLLGWISLVCSDFHRTNIYLGISRCRFTKLYGCKSLRRKKQSAGEHERSQSPRHFRGASLSCFTVKERALWFRRFVCWIRGSH